MTLTANDLPWKPDKNKPVSRLLFDDKISQRVKIKPQKDASHFYYITDVLLTSGILPLEYEPPMILRKISIDGELPLLYRLTVWTEKNNHKKVWRAFIIEVISDTEFIFTPPITLID